MKISGLQLTQFQGIQLTILRKRLSDFSSRQVPSWHPRGALKRSPRGVSGWPNIQIGPGELARFAPRGTPTIWGCKAKGAGSPHLKRDNINLEKMHGAVRCDECGMLQPEKMAYVQKWLVIQPSAIPGSMVGNHAFPTGCGWCATTWRNKWLVVFAWGVPTNHYLSAIIHYYSPSGIIITFQGSLPSMILQHGPSTRINLHSWISINRD